MRFKNISYTMERGRLLFKAAWYTSKVSMSHVVTFRAHPVQIFPHSNMTYFRKNPVVCWLSAVALAIINSMIFSQRPDC